MRSVRAREDASSWTIPGTSGRLDDLAPLPRRAMVVPILCFERTHEDSPCPNPLRTSASSAACTHAWIPAPPFDHTKLPLAGKSSALPAGLVEAEAGKLTLRPGDG